MHKTLRIPGSLTSDVQTCDTVKKKPFKSHARAEQEEHDIAQARRGISIPRSSRLDILRRVELSNRKADQEINGPLAFKQTGATLALDGSEDHKLSRVLQVAWKELKMAEFRSNYIQTAPKYTPLELFYALETVQEANLEPAEASDHDMSEEDNDEEANALDDELAVESPASGAEPGPIEGASPKPAAGGPPEDDLWSFCTTHKSGPRLRAKMELHRRTKRVELELPRGPLVLGENVMSGGRPSSPPPAPKPKPKPKPAPKPGRKRKRGDGTGPAPPAASPAQTTQEHAQSPAQVPGQGTSQAQAYGQGPAGNGPHLLNLPPLPPLPPLPLMFPVGFPWPWP